MTNEDLVKIVQRGENASFLIGQIHGKLHQIIQGVNTPNTFSDVRGDLIQLFDYITQEVGNIYYDTGVKDENHM